MPAYVDWNLGEREDGLFTVGLAPPIAIGGWNIQFTLLTRFGGISGLVTKSCASGFSGVSGITVTNSGNGTFQVSINSADTSGFNPNAYAYTVERLDTGFRTELLQGYLLLGSNQNSD